MIRKIIKIDEEKCNGCGLCADACHENAIEIINGKARLLRDDYCDGLGNCLPVCPTGAIAIEEREAKEFDEEAVKQNADVNTVLPCGCPGSHAHEIERGTEKPSQQISAVSELRQWPVQIKLIPVSAPYYENSALLVAADCAAYSHANFHAEFMRNKITLIGCPKLDNVEYGDKLSEILRQNNVTSVTVVRMEVPCCGGIEQAVRAALKNSGKIIPWSVITLGTDGEIREKNP